MAMVLCTSSFSIDSTRSFTTQFFESDSSSLACSGIGEPIWLGVGFALRKDLTLRIVHQQGLAEKKFQPYSGRRELITVSKVEQFCNCIGY